MSKSSFINIKRIAKDKRAVSEVLATILIVLFVIAALVIVSVVLFQFIRSKSQEITAGCVSIDIAITKAEYNQTGNITIVYAKRAGGDAEMAGMKFVFDGKEKMPSSESDNASLKILETGRYIFNNITSKPRKIEAAPIVKTEAEKEMNCGIKATIAEKDIVEKSISVSENIEPSIAGLVGYWKLDEGTGTTASDSSGNNNHGSLINAPVWTAGKKGNALSFDGSDDVVVWDNNQSFDLSDKNFTISMWVKPSTVSPSYQALFMINAHYGVYMRMKQNKIALLISNNGASWDVWPTGEGAVSVFTANEWHHVVLVRSRDNFNITVNNINAISVSWSGAIAYSPSKDSGIGIEASAAGSFTSGYAWPFNGIIDEVRIYNRALTAVDVSQL